MFAWRRDGKFTGKEWRGAVRARGLVSAEDEDLSRAPSRREDGHLLGLVAAVVIVCALYFGRIVFIPLALSVLVAVVLTPAVAFLERVRLRRALAIFVVMLGLVCAAGLIAWTVLPQFADFMGHLPEYEQDIQYKVNKLKGSTSKLSGATESVQALEAEITLGGTQTSGQKEPKEKAPGTSASRPLAVQVVSRSNPMQIAKGLADPLETALAVLVFAIFILGGREDLRDRLIKLTSRGRLNVMTQAMTEAWNRINRYLFMQMLVNSCYGLTGWVRAAFSGRAEGGAVGISGRAAAVFAVYRLASRGGDRHGDSVGCVSWVDARTDLRLHLHRAGGGGLQCR